MQFKCDALMLRYADFKESDRMVTLLTAEGKLSAAMKGVRKRGARLAFAAQPFFFGEYVLNRSAGRNTVISADSHDGFYSLREDVFRFYAAAVVTEVCDKLVYEDSESGAFLLLAVNTLKELCSFSGRETGEQLVKFLLRALALAGYAVRADRCPACGNALHGLLRFDMEEGAFFCADCNAGVRASENTYRVVRAVLHGERTEEGDGVLRALRLLGAYFTSRTETTVSALKEYISLF